MQLLGTEEVIATVRDDGDVDVVMVRHVVGAIERRALEDSSLGPIANEIRPIFQRNVGVSAWGLSIHTEARILAVSSNAHEVRVFKFGLLQHGESHVAPVAGEPEDPDAPARHSTAHRALDVTQRILNGTANIPHISFCNTGDDPDARWLLTTDVAGYCRAIDLHAPDEGDGGAQKFRFGRSFGYGSGYDRLNAGWGVMFLDRRSFRSTSRFEHAVGIAEGSLLPGMPGKGLLWDLSDVVEGVPGAAEAFTHRQEREYPRTRLLTRLSGRQPDEADLGPELEPVVASHDHVFPLIVGVGSGLRQSESDDDDTDDEDVGGVSLSEFSDALEPTLDHHNSEDSNSDIDMDDDSDIDFTNPLPPNGQHTATDLVYDDFDPEDEGTEDSTPFSALYSGKRLHGNLPHFSYGRPLCDGLPCPIFHTSAKNVYLLQPSKPGSKDRASQDPMVGLANPLRQALRPEDGGLNMFDRLNMHAYIPSLGIIIVASQKGRTLVLALTKVPRGTPCPPDVEGGRRYGHTVYAMRVEAVLPFADQESTGERPVAPLHGIAVAPLQGGEKSGRWRLLIHYQDHSLLSYELARPKDESSGLVVIV